MNFIKKEIKSITNNKSTGGQKSNLAKRIANAVKDGGKKVGKDNRPPPAI